MDKSTGIDPKTSLDQALSQQMQILVMKKRDALKERVSKIWFCFVLMSGFGSLGFRREAMKKVGNQLLAQK